MIRVLEDKMAGGGVVPKHYVEIACLTSDTKPTEGIAQGSICLEQDATSGAVTPYMFNEATGSWVKIT